LKRQTAFPTIPAALRRITPCCPLKTPRPEPVGSGLGNERTLLATMSAPCAEGSGLRYLTLS
jgi:hypothetical protein